MEYKERLEFPPKGVDVVAYDSDGSKHYIYRCNCQSDYCTEWRDSIGGGALMVKIVRWEFLNKEDNGN